MNVAEMPALTVPQVRPWLCGWPGVPGKINYFHPSVAAVTDDWWVLTMQRIHNSDHYGAPEFAVSRDRGRSWSEPAPIPGFAVRPLPGTGLAEAVVDIRAFAVPGEAAVAVFGCTVSYTPHGNVFWESKQPVARPAQRAVYSILRRNGGWSREHDLTGLPARVDCRTASTQVVANGGQWLIPIYMEVGKCRFAGRESAAFGAAVGRYELKADKFEIQALSNVLTHEGGRGFCEPSLVAAEGCYHLTLRAEDGRGYISSSDDALHWEAPRPWRWAEDGAALEMSSTQQHWLTLGGRTFLVYTRKTAANQQLMRFRAPLLMAPADLRNGTLQRSGEQIIFPCRRQGALTALYGNFHCAKLDDRHALVTDSALFYRCENERMEDISSEIMGAGVSV